MRFVRINPDLFLFERKHEIEKKSNMFLFEETLDYVW